MYTFVTWAICGPMWVCDTTQEFLLVLCYWYKRCNIIIDIQKQVCIYSFVTLLLIYVSGRGRVKAASETQEWKCMGNFNWTSKVMKNGQLSCI